MLKSFSAETGIKVRYIEALGSTLIKKGKNLPPADVVILVGDDHREKAIGADLFYSRPSLALNRLVPNGYKDRLGRWYVLDTSHEYKSYAGIPKKVNNKQNGIALIKYLLSPDVNLSQGYVASVHGSTVDDLMKFANEGLKEHKESVGKKTAYKSPSSNTSPSQRVQKTEVKVSQNDFHEKCKDARDYQGCLNAFTGGSSSSSSGLSQYEREQLELRRQELEQQRSATRYNQMVEDQNRARQARQERNRNLMNLMDSFKPKPSVTCTSTPNYLGGASTTCQ